MLRLLLVFSFVLRYDIIYEKINIRDMFSVVFFFLAFMESGRGFFGRERR